MADTARKQKLAIRLTYYFLGLIIMAVGISMTIRADIGVAPGGVLPFAVSKLTPLRVGLCISIFQILCVLVQFSITRRATLKLALQLLMAYVFGLLIDIFYVLFNVELSIMSFRILLLLAGLFIFSFGIRIIIGAAILLVPPDALAFTIGDKFGWAKSRAKLVFDVAVTFAAALLTLTVAGNAFLTVGIGTVICAIGTGPIIALFTKLFPFFDVQKAGEPPPDISGL